MSNLIISNINYYDFTMKQYLCDLSVIRSSVHHTLVHYHSTAHKAALRFGKTIESAFITPPLSPAGNDHSSVWLKYDVRSTDRQQFTGIHTQAHSCCIMRIVNCVFQCLFLFVGNSNIMTTSIIRLENSWS